VPARYKGNTAINQSPEWLFDMGTASKVSRFGMDEALDGVVATGRFQPDQMNRLFDSLIHAMHRCLIAPFVIVSRQLETRRMNGPVLPTRPRN